MVVEEDLREDGIEKMKSSFMIDQVPAWDETDVLPSCVVIVPLTTTAGTTVDHRHPHHLPRQMILKLPLKYHRVSLKF